jgi:hypothetical protein
MIKSEKDYKSTQIPENIEDPDAKGYLELKQLAGPAADYELGDDYPGHSLLS